LKASPLISSKLLNTVEQQGVWKFLNLFKRFLRGFIMKKLSILALALFAASAFASGPSHGGGSSGPTLVDISGTSIQAAVFDGSAVINRVTGHDNLGQQNLATNAGAVDVSGGSLQVVYAKNSVIWNDVSDHDNIGSQNLSSNVGNVDVGGTSIQITAMQNSAVLNVVSGYRNNATQNIASNNSCVTCNK
jgi:hypothetical protein